MKASIIIPCWNSAETLEDCLVCLRAQTLEDFEAVFVDDGSADETPDILARAAAEDPRFRVLTHPANRGVSAARNTGLEAARGEFVFFADPDDTFRPDMLEKGVRAMESDGADYCVFPYREKNAGETDFHVVSLKGTCRYSSNGEIRTRHLPRLFGYSADQVRAWYAGEPLSAHRWHGGVVTSVFRRDVIETHHVRFDERIGLYEDAMFNCEYMLWARRMTCVDEPLYDYVHRSTGAIACLRGGDYEIRNKFELLRKRKELDAKAEGGLAPLFACSCVFSLLEMLRIVLICRNDVPLKAGLSRVRAYAQDPVVRRALASFPLSIRRPGLACAVLLLRGTGNFFRKK